MTREWIAETILRDRRGERGLSDGDAGRRQRGGDDRHRRSADVDGTVATCPRYVAVTVAVPCARAIDLRLRAVEDDGREDGWIARRPGDCAAGEWLAVGIERRRRRKGEVSGAQRGLIDGKQDGRNGRGGVTPVTLTFVMPATPALVATISASPVVLAVTTPSDVTVAMVGSWLVH